MRAGAAVGAAGGGVWAGGVAAGASPDALSRSLMAKGAECTCTNMTRQSPLADRRICMRTGEIACISMCSCSWRV